MLRCIVVGKANRRRMESINRGNIDNLATSLFLHCLTRMFCRKENATQVYVHDAFEFLRIHFGKGSRWVNAGIIDEDINRAKLLLTGCDKMNNSALI